MRGVPVEGQVEAEDGGQLDGGGDGALKGKVEWVEREVRREAGVERLRHRELVEGFSSLAIKVKRI